MLQGIKSSIFWRSRAKLLKEGAEDGAEDVVQAVGANVMNHRAALRAEPDVECEQRVQEVVNAALRPSDGVQARQRIGITPADREHVVGLLLDDGHLREGCALSNKIDVEPLVVIWLRRRGGREGAGGRGGRHGGRGD